VSSFLRLKDGIPKDEAHVRYDDMRPFGQELRSARNKSPQQSLILFKSDVASAFLNLPAHPIGQLNQTVVVDGNFHIVRRLVFGNRASPRCWCAVSGLICWIAIHKYSIEGLHVYMDDFFGWDFSDFFFFFFLYINLGLWGEALSRLYKLLYYVVYCYWYMKMIN
jgi:hypothetical protein